MATTKELEARLAELTALLAQQGIRVEDQAEESGARPDYIEFGSREHAVFLGLVECKEVPDDDAFQTYTSPRTGRVFRLEDEVTAFMHYPDPKQVAALVLRQKVSELEAGKPTVPPTAPPLWRPRDVPV